MLEMSERARVAIETAPPHLKRLLKEVVRSLDRRSNPDPKDQKLTGRDTAWVSCVTDSVRLVYLMAPDGIVIDDVIDLNRYK